MRLDGLSRENAVQILHQLSSTGTPPKGFCRYLTIGFDDTMKNIGDTILDNLLPSRMGSIRVILAENGNGKTHLCNHILEMASSRGLATAEVQMTTDRNFSNPKEIYRQIAKNIQLHPFTGFDSIVSSFDGRAVEKAEASLNRSFSSAIAAISVHKEANSAYEPFIRTWLRGDSVPSHLRRELDIKETLSDRNALNWLQQLALALVCGGIRGLVVVLDETEAEIGSARRALLARLTVLLRVINGALSGQIPGCLFIITCITSSIPFFESRGDLLPVRQRLFPEFELRHSSGIRVYNPRSVRIDADGTGEVPLLLDWLELMAERIAEIGSAAGIEVSSGQRTEIDELIDLYSTSRITLRKRSFIREVCGVVNRRD